MQIRQLHPLFAGEVSGVDIRQPPNSETVAAIDRAMDQYAVLVFRGQPLNQDEQIAFASSFGELDIGLAKLSQVKGRLDYPELIDISNVARDGSIAPSGDKRIAGALANQLWHSDSSFQYVPGKYSMLSAVVVPPATVMGAGETESAGHACRL
jgi:alpha-ketoglutarate-dependent 2,4-dichlorophenoxyacetate dioxygenase